MAGRSQEVRKSVPLTRKEELRQQIVPVKNDGTWVLDCSVPSKRLSKVLSQEHLRVTECCSAPSEQFCGVLLELVCRGGRGPDSPAELRGMTACTFVVSNLPSAGRREPGRLAW